MDYNITVKIGVTFQHDDMFIIKQKHLEAALGIHEGTPLASELVNAEDSVIIARAVISSLDATALDNEDATVSTVEELLHQIVSDIQPSHESSADQVYGVVFKNVYLDNVIKEKGYMVVKYFTGCMTRVGEIISSTVSLFFYTDGLYSIISFFKPSELPITSYLSQLEIAILSFFTTILRGFVANE